MASFYDLEGDGVSRNGADDGSDEIGESEPCDIYMSENHGHELELLDDLESYWEDIKDHLTISRMVSDSVTKGMVNAVSQEAAENIAAKELEIVNLKEMLRCHQFLNSEMDASTLRNYGELQLPECHRESLSLLNQAVKEQLERLGKCIAYTKDPREIMSTSDTSELGQNLEESLMIKNDFYEAFICLKATLNSMCQQVDVIACSPESFVEEWKVDLDICKEVEAMVFCTIFQGLQCEFEKKLWNVDIILALIDKLNGISGLRHELASIQKYFVGLENGNLSPQGSMEMDHLHRKFSSNHGLSSAQLCDGNGRCEESKYSMSENLPLKLNHMSAEELYQHFRTVITEMKREHESTVQMMTEENFTLRRELLKERELVKERPPFAAFKKDKEFETIKKRICEVIGKLDEIVMENEKLSEFCNHSKETLDSLLSENHQLKDLLIEQKLEVQNLSSQASNAAEKLLRRSWAEENLHKQVGDLELTLQDERIEASIGEEVFKCMIKEMASLIDSSCEDLDLKSIIMQDIIGTIYDQIYYSVEIASKLDSEENSVLQSSMIQQIYEIVFQEVLRETSMELDAMKDRCLKEDELAMMSDENKQLKHKVLVLENSSEEKDKLLLEHTTQREIEKAEFVEELNNLMCLRTCQEAEISERNEKIELLKHKLEDCQKQLDFCTFEVENLNKSLELSKNELKKCEEEKKNIISVLEQKQNYVASIKLNDLEHSKHMESLCHVIHDLSKSFADFELRIKESIGWNNVRLENSAFQLHSLIPKVNVLRRTGSLYKERLDKKCSDLQKAEAEVDLLGDEVDTLLNLLEKIYVALDHYSPIFQHYPGIIEILKLVKRELSGEADKAS